MHKSITSTPLSCCTRSYPIPNPWVSRDFATPTQLGLPPQPQHNAGLRSEVRLVEIKLLRRVEQCSMHQLIQCTRHQQLSAAARLADVKCSSSHHVNSARSAAVCSAYALTDGPPDFPEKQTRCVSAQYIGINRMHIW